MVRVVRLERTVSWSQTRRDTNFAIPGYSISAIIPRRRGKSKIFLSVVIPVVKAAFVPTFCNRGKSRKRRRHKALRRFSLPCPGYRHGTPKPGAIPTSLYPDIQFLPLYHGGGGNQRFFCLWSFMWSKPLLCRFRQPEENPLSPVPQGIPGFCQSRAWIGSTRSQTTRATNCATPGCEVSADSNGICQWSYLYPDLYIIH